MHTGYAELLFSKSYLCASKNINGILRLLLISFFIVTCLPVLAQQAAVDSNAINCFFLKSIHIDGRRKTKDVIVLRELNVKEGNCLPSEKLSSLAEQNRLRLLNLGLFSDVRVELVPAAKDSVEMYIVVLDRFPIMPEGNFEFADRNFNVWWTEQHRDLRRINLGVTLTHNNFRGNREVISVTGQAGYTQKIGISYSRPFVDKAHKHGYGVSVFGLQNREIAYMSDSNKLKFLRSDDNFMQRRTDIALWYTYRPAYANVHLIEFSYHHYWISDTIRQLNADYIGVNRSQQNVLALRYRLEHNGVDNWNYPLKGKRFIGVWEQKLAVAGLQWQTTLQAQYDHYINPASKWYAAFIFRAKVSFPQQQPYIFRANLGYDYNYIRGYEYYVIDGSSFGIARATVKRELLNVRIHSPVRFFEMIPVRVYGKLYGDLGAGYNKYPVNDKLYNRALYSAGLGIDIVTLYDIKLRVEYTINHRSEKALYLHRNGE